MELYQFKKVKEDRTFTDFVLTWEHNNKVFKLYVRPCFYRDMKVIKARAVKVDDLEGCK